VPRCGTRQAVANAIIEAVTAPTRLISSQNVEPEVVVMSEETVNVRYMVDDVDSAVEFYTSHLGFEVRSNAAPAFADVVRGSLRLLLSGPRSSAGRPMPDGSKPGPGGWNRIEFVVDDIQAEVDRLRAAGLTFRNDVVTGPGGAQILLEDPSGNVIELFQPAAA
jgi:catechol 2,3-dioxygenase-like lactoylglutathione lyase family enzyme